MRPRLTTSLAKLVSSQVLGEISQKLRWKETEKDTRRQPLAFALAQNLCI